MPDDKNEHGSDELIARIVSDYLMGNTTIYEGWAIFIDGKPLGEGAPDWLTKEKAYLLSAYRSIKKSNRRRKQDVKMKKVRVITIILKELEEV